MRNPCLLHEKVWKNCETSDVDQTRETDTFELLLTGKTRKSEELFCYCFRTSMSAFKSNTTSGLNSRFTIAYRQRVEETMVLMQKCLRVCSNQVTESY